MDQRLQFYPLMPQAFAKLAELETLAKESGLEHGLIHLMKLRASQINGCAFCVDMHSKQAKIDGERELRLHHVIVWRESPLFSAREKAALLWTETVTLLSESGVPDAVYAQVKAHFTDKELTALTLVVALINAWNRFSVAFRSVPGSQDRAFGLEKAGLS